MPKVNIDHSSPHNASDTFSKVKEMLTSDESLKKIDNSIQCTFDEGSLTGSVDGTKFKAKVDVQEQGDKSRVNIIVDLPMLLSPFKGKVKTTIEKKLAKILA